MSRVIILLLDSFGIGCAEDAAKFGDTGADTLGHINEWCAKNRKDESGKPKYLSCRTWICWVSGRPLRLAGAKN